MQEKYTTHCMIARKEKELCIKISDKNITITRKIFQFKEFPEDSRRKHFHCADLSFRKM